MYTETDSLDSITGGLAGICLAVGPNRACYIPVGHRGADMFSDAPQQLPLDLVIARLKPLLCDDSVLKIGHNIKYDLCVLGGLDLDVAPLDDTMVMSFDLDRSEEHTSELQSLMRISYAVFCLKKKKLKN